MSRRDNLEELGAFQDMPEEREGDTANPLTILRAEVEALRKERREPEAGPDEVKVRVTVADIAHALQGIEQGTLPWIPLAELKQIHVNHDEVILIFEATK